MGSIRRNSFAAAVTEHLERDLVMAQALDRGILNQAATARWLIEKVVPEATKAGVVSVLRRWEPTRHWQRDDGVFDALKNTHVSIASGWAVFDVTRSVASHQRLVKLRQRIHPNEPLHTLFGHRAFRVAVPTEVAHEARIALGPENIEQEFSGAAQIGFRRHEPDANLNLPLSTVLGLHTFGSAGIRVLASYGFQDECYVFLPQEDIRQGYHLALALSEDEEDRWTP